MQFTVTETTLPDVMVFEYREFGDERGSFAEVFHKSVFQEHSLPDFSQQNQSKSAKGVLRGLHFQNSPDSIAKLVRCVHGHIFDVAVDIRKSSPHYGQWFGIHLTGDDTKMLLVPDGFAHGFLTLQDNTIVNYQQSGYWSPTSERSILWSDPEIGIDWPLGDIDNVDLSGKDQIAVCLKDSDHNFN